MTPDEITSAVLADDELRTLADKGDDTSVAKLLVQKQSKVPKSFYIGERGIFNVLGMQAGEIFMQTVEGLAASTDLALAPFKRVDRWLKDSIGLDIGNPIVQGTLQSMTKTQGGPFDDLSVQTLIELGSQPQSFSVDEISNALNLHRKEGSTEIQASMQGVAKTKSKKRK